MRRWLERLRRKRLVLLGAGVGLALAAWLLSSLLTPLPDPWLEALHKRGYPASAAELDAWYVAVPPAENVALFYTNAFSSLSNSSGPITNLMIKSWLPPIGQGLSAEDRNELQAVLADKAHALRLLHSAPSSGRSRYPINLQDGPATLVPHLYKIKQGVSLLSAEGLLHATDGNAEGATRAFLAAGRLADSVSEEPLIISQLVRYAAWAILLPRLERALSLTPFTDDQLASLQKLIAEAERPRAAARGWAGDQAIHLSLYTDRKMLREALRTTGSSRSKAGNWLVLAGVGLFRASGFMEKDRAYFCEQMGRGQAAFELPYPARFAACEQLANLTNVPNRLFFFSKVLLPAVGNYHLRDADHVALVRVAVTALAIERFRLAHTNALPDSLEQLSPSCCRAVPSDPYNGKPLRYKIHGASYAVYSVGSDGQDDGGVTWATTYAKIPQDIAFVVKH